MRNLSHPRFFFHLPHFLQWPVPPKSISQPSLICLFLASWLPLLWIPTICHLYHCSIFLTGAPGPIATSLKLSLEPKESFYDGKLIVFLLCSYVISDSQGLIAVVFKFNVQELCKRVSFLNDWMKIVGILCPVYAGCGVFLKNIVL